MIKSNKKRKLLDCILSLKEINEAIASFSVKERQEILPLCQQMAVEMGTTIEKSEEEQAETVSLLEKYCEEIYSLYMAKESKSIQGISVSIERLLTAVEQRIEELKEVPDEILFLPYKASMWDAMESVYQAAVKQPGCHVTVMPIPYYNVNPEGEILSVEYEGNLFSREITITNIKDYNLEERKPDAVFIHNPYDQHNYVTRVAPSYFSSELIKYTDRLVYLPYFVASWNHVKDYFCLLPGVKNAWRTFVQSESIRTIYAKYSRRPESIVALGSPKFDQVKKTEQNLSRVPEEWKEVFKNKKVFLLNTHLSSIINLAEEMVKKLTEIFTFFESRQDIVLIWRPHPLSVETAKSLNPDFTSRYLELIGRFRTMSIGIYDESADLHRAIAVSDGYIGDTSSIVPLYGVTGKPIFIYSYAATNIEEKEKIVTEEERRKKEEKIKCFMQENIEALQFLYFEKFISLEYYIELVKAGRGICDEDRKRRFLDLQYGFEEEKTAGERIWEYVYKRISGEENV